MGKFWEDADKPNKIIRVEGSSDIEYRYKERFELPVLLEIAKNLFDELGTRYGINIPAEFFIGKDRWGIPTPCSSVDKIEGQNIRDIEPTAEISEKIQKLYASITKYFLDKLQSDDYYLTDICGPSNYVYGNKTGKNDKEIYLVDTDIYFNKGKMALYSSVEWLAIHLSGIEKRFSIKLDDARKNLEQFITQPIPFILNQDEVQKVFSIKDEISKYLAGEWRFSEQTGRPILEYTD